MFSQFVINLYFEISCSLTKIIAVDKQDLKLFEGSIKKALFENNFLNTSDSICSFGIKQCHKFISSLIQYFVSIKKLLQITSKIITNYVSFITNHIKILLRITFALFSLPDYYKLRWKIIMNYVSFITNCVKMLLRITFTLLQITAKNYYKLLQNFITNYGSSYQREK